MEMPPWWFFALNGVGFLMFFAFVCFIRKEYLILEEYIHGRDVMQERVHTHNEMPKPVYDLQGRRIS